MSFAAPKTSSNAPNQAAEVKVPPSSMPGHRIRRPAKAAPAPAKLSFKPSAPKKEQAKPARAFSAPTRATPPPSQFANAKQKAEAARAARLAGKK